MTTTTAIRALTEHHPWCNSVGLPREECKQCAGLYERYPLRDGESLDAMTARLFPDVVTR